MTVYITQEMRGRDISHAFEFGEVQTLLPPDAPVTQQNIKIMQDNLYDFSTNKDHLILAGDPAWIGIACAIVSDTTGGLFRLLRWDRLNESYQPVLVDLWTHRNSNNGGL
jgi:hypothetical protein